MLIALAAVGRFLIRILFVHLNHLIVDFQLVFLADPSCIVRHHISATRRIGRGFSRAESDLYNIAILKDRKLG